MSNAANNGPFDKTNTRRKKRGGVKNNEKKFEDALHEELMKLVLTEPSNSQTKSSEETQTKTKWFNDSKTQNNVPKNNNDTMHKFNFPQTNNCYDKTKKNVKWPSQKSANRRSLTFNIDEGERQWRGKSDWNQQERKGGKDESKRLIEVTSQNGYNKIEKESNLSQEIINSAVKDARFPKYIRIRDMLSILDEQDADDPLYVKGSIRINPKNMNHAFLTVDAKTDILIKGIRNRNRAMEKDIVAVKINPENEWRTLEDLKVQKTGTVVCILERVHSRMAIGTVEKSKNKNKLKLRSRDLRIPMMLINPDDIPESVLSKAEGYRNTLFLASIANWPTPHYCIGKIEREMGDVGNLEIETEAILVDNGLDVTPYSSELIEGLPNSDYVPTASDLEDREDWREECVFTIDPATAVDLDDAVSCKILPNGNYEVGVHISDVTHYLQASSPLDERVAERATTVYLVNTVYHMLPKTLCQLCSLLPGQDKLSFSVIWEMTPRAEVVKHRFAKSVVNSCYQMAYETAQTMIDEPTRQWSGDELPGLKGKFTGEQLSVIVNNLYRLSTQMRNKRFADGALSLNQPKLQIILDKDTGYPTSYRMEEQQDSNRLVEEFMLLANMTVAKHLHESLPNTALLRVHGEPLKRVIDKTSDDLSRFGIHLNTESAGNIQSSLSFYEKSGLPGPEPEFVTNCRMMVLNALCAQSMPRARYTCSALIEEVEDLRHFALNVPFYTHFTSPIRRYADCIVHRLLYASITQSSLPNDWSPALCAKIAANCNGKKYSAELAQEKSNELYFIDFLGRAGSTETVGIVMKVTECCLDVILCHVGINVRLTRSQIEKNAKVIFDKNSSVPTVVVKWKDSSQVQVINVFSLINLVISKHEKMHAVQAELLSPRLIK